MANMTQANATTQLKGCGCTDEDCQKLAALPNLNWGNLLAIIQKYGPIIVPVILSLFGNAPAVDPLPQLPS